MSTVPTPSAAAIGVAPWYAADSIIVAVQQIGDVTWRNAQAEQQITEFDRFRVSVFVDGEFESSVEVNAGDLDSAIRTAESALLAPKGFTQVEDDAPSRWVKAGLVHWRQRYVKREAVE